MLDKHLALALLGTILISAPALSQTNQPAGSTTAPPAGSTAAPSAGDPSFGANEPARMNTGNWMTQEQPGQWRASKLEGLNVYNQNNEKIGDISELLVDSSGKVQAVVVGVGGFLGLGERDVAIPFEQIKLVNEPRTVATTATTTDPNAPVAPRPTATAPAAPGTVSPTAPTTTGTVATDRSADNAAHSAPDHAILTTNLTKDQLKAAPEFKYAR
ncbi:PRC-barrel domain-containing protein [Microvirga sp. HBU67558]|uniref:PRC-barrel domain-containing protein n=1 Tax=Microvirga TaxID=186650 RepID=UPI001B386D07|nr:MULTISPECIES: PRC-barrel domain-containing protein [unclassified Microvirga]MBQ0819353.1 PRC-barrel domain-containing protein [Microvirga sp. HBU67558]